MGNQKFASLEDVLGKEAAELQAVKQGTIETDKLGDLPITAINNPEYKEIKKDCIKMVPNGTGGMEPDVDDDLLMLKVIVTAVEKDERSDFTFANKKLLAKVGAQSATAAVEKLLSPGEIFRAANAIQDISGWGAKSKKETEKEVKNS